MAVSNIGPEHFDHGYADSGQPRRGNPAPLYRDETITDDVSAATTRATVVSHRFGDVRHALSRPATRRPANDEGGFDARD